MYIVQNVCLFFPYYIGSLQLKRWCKTHSLSLFSACNTYAHARAHTHIHTRNQICHQSFVPVTGRDKWVKVGWVKLHQKYTFYNCIKTQITVGIIIKDFLSTYLGSVRHATSLSSFKSKLKTHLFSSAYWFLAFFLLFPSKSNPWLLCLCFCGVCVCARARAWVWGCGGVCVCVSVWVWHAYLLCKRPGLP